MLARILIECCGILALFAVAVAISSNRRAIKPSVVARTFALQALLAVLVLYVPIGRHVVATLGQGVMTLLSCADAGIDAVFGDLAGPAVPHSIVVHMLPVIVFFSALISVLHHFGIITVAIRVIGGAIGAITGTDRLEALYAATNIFLGGTEAPLTIRPYLATVPDSRLFAIMTTGMAGVAGTVIAVYAQLGVRVDYLLAASVMSAPGGLLMAKIVVPDDPAENASGDELDASALAGERHVNVIMAAAAGAQTGLRMAAGVGAMVLAFVALIALLNVLLRVFGMWVHIPGLSVQGMIGTLFAPAMTLFGLDWHEAEIAGRLLGVKIALNEFIAYVDFGRSSAILSRHAQAVVTFALCGFANISAIAMQIAVLGSLAPTLRETVARLGLRALAAGTLANLMSAGLAGLLIS